MRDRDLISEPRRRSNKIKSKIPNVPFKKERKKGGKGKKREKEQGDVGIGTKKKTKSRIDFNCWQI